MNSICARPPQAKKTASCPVVHMRRCPHEVKVALQAHTPASSIPTRPPSNAARPGRKQSFSRRLRSNRAHGSPNYLQDDTRVLLFPLSRETCTLQAPFGILLAVCDPPHTLHVKHVHRSALHPASDHHSLVRQCRDYCQLHIIPSAGAASPGQRTAPDARRWRASSVARSHYNLRTVCPDTYTHTRTHHLIEPILSNSTAAPSHPQTRLSYG
ncbi:hypothetical protein BU16DRAFT_530960 [Lophium mytilinum]|uniref:Uncharacterized protein n=1 Tax=Lophium mytilinum TaxID=390894 RepID=A0A6A6QDX1_9PEZI|nr:hypothetical protein BU16DRAFT_530960 [Lophium mytilinum]